MTTSRTSFLTEIIDDKAPISGSKLAYFRERQRNRLFDKVVGCFLEKERTGKLTRADLARRLRKSPEQITRWLSTPGNWTSDTISDLTLAICGGELSLSINLLSEMPKRNSTQADLLGHSFIKSNTSPSVTIASITIESKGTPHAARTTTR
jgi:hypothetical protein